MSEQLALIEQESDEAMLLPREVAAKRYTATTAERLEQRRNHILDLIAFGMPVNFIAERCHCSHRIVTLLGAKHAATVTASALTFAAALKSFAASAMFFARQKMPEAKFGELTVGMGIATQRAGEIEAAAQGLADLGATTEVEAVNPAVEAARKWLQSRVHSPKSVANSREAVEV